MADSRIYAKTAILAAGITKLYNIAVDLVGNSDANKFTLEELFAFMESYAEINDILIQDLDGTNKSLATIVNQLVTDVQSSKYGST